MEPPHKILIVEDNPQVREIVQELLEVEGYEVITAEHGADALRVLESEPSPSLILLDLMMPVMDGWEFLDALRAHERLAHVPVALLTAYQDRAPVDQVQAVVTKPPVFAVLLNTVRQLIRPPAIDAADPA